MNKHYVFDNALKVWLPPVLEAFAYSDGDESEAYLLSVLKAARDVSSCSTELYDAIRDWPSEYHLSPVRHNLLRPFQFKSTDRILELGCGCGSITRYLGENGATVVAVEGSLRRAEIAAEHCRDLPNVTVYCDNIASFSYEEKFDYVTLVGVLEYARVFIPSASPVQACLDIAKSFLHVNGALIVAIENQLGLKYFAGGEEDHVGRSFYGVHGLYGAKTPVTFGRHVLQEHLHAVGLNDVRFYYPFPDYKLPSVLLSESAFSHPELRVADLLARASSGKRDGEYRSIHEGLAWHAVAENRLVGELANSFLIFARSEEGDISPDWLFKTFSTSRRSRFWTETVIRQGIDKLVVEKRSIAPGLQESLDSPLYHNKPENSQYVRGELWVVGLWKLLVSGAEIDEIGLWLLPWLRFLQEHCISGDAGTSGLDFLLPADYVDCTPFNLIMTPDGNLSFIDSEWSAAEAVPAFWVVIRGLLFSIQGTAVPLSLSGQGIMDFVGVVVRACGVELKSTHWERMLELENGFQKFVGSRSTLEVVGATGQHTFADLSPSLLGFADYHAVASELARVLGGSDMVSEHVRGCGGGYKLKAEFALRAEVERVKNSFSWRITAPLRVVYNLSGRFFRALRGD